MYKTGIVRDPIYIEHDMGAYHPENPQRLVVAYDMLDRTGLSEKLVKVPIRRATKEEVLWIHNESYYDQIASTEGQVRSLDPDTSTSPKSFEAALKAAGSTLNAVDMILNGEIDNAMALVRPPGHHAEAGQAKGFCIFNNIAIAAEYAMRKFGCMKVAIVDWDVHHGNGTQNSFYGTDKVFYLSSHQYPFFPGSGDYSETGWEKGEGYTLNAPLTSGYGNGDFIKLYSEVFAPKIVEFNPDILLISAGFDIYFGDLIGGMTVTPEGFEGLLTILMKTAEECCDGKFLIVLEGGYNIEGEAECIQHLLELMPKPTTEHPLHRFKPEQPEMIEATIRKLLAIHGN